MKTCIYKALFGLLLFIGFQTNAQDIFYSKAQKFTLQNGDLNIVGWCGDRLYTYRSSKEGYYLDAYNDSMRLLATVALDYFPKKIFETQFYATSESMVVLYQAIQHNEVVQYAARLDDKARIIGKPKALDSVKIGWFSSNKEYYNSVGSADRSKIMIYSIGRKKSRKININTILLDKDLNVLGKGAPFIETNDDVNIDQALLSNDGMLYLAGSPEHEYKRFGDNAWIFRLSPNGQQFDVVPLPLTGSYVSPVYMKVNDQTNEIYLGAYYSDDKSDNNEGVIYGVLPPIALEFSTFKKIPFDEELRNVSDERNKKRAFNDYEVRKIIVKNDGGFILVGENYNIAVRSYNYGMGAGYYNYYNTGGYNNTTVREYHYGDVMVLSYDKDGNRKWHSFIRKDQNSTDDGGMFSSYAMLNSGASLVFLYNDYTLSKSVLSIAAIDIDGNLQMKKVNPSGIGLGDWVARTGKQTDIKEIVIPVLKKDNLSFARVAF
jgi:hypothetical protein